MLRVISLGAGVQSTTMALMAAHGEIGPMPDCAIFADTGNEPAAVYDHFRWLTSGNMLPFPVHIVSAGNLGDQILLSTQGLSKRGSHARPPFYVRTVIPAGTVVPVLDENDVQVGERITTREEIEEGMIRRQCTGDYKIDPIEKKVRELLGLKARQWWPEVESVEQWIGISTDEATRQKPSMRPAIRMRWPLIEKRMSRSDCLLWMQRNGYPEPPKSACTFCPYRSDQQWRHIRDTDPAGWAYALKIDEAIRGGGWLGQDCAASYICTARSSPCAMLTFRPMLSGASRTYSTTNVKACAGYKNR